jgi:hypothetical protein
MLRDIGLKRGDVLAMACGLTRKHCFGGAARQGLGAERPGPGNRIEHRPDKRAAITGGECDRGGKVPPLEMHEA